MPRKKLVLSALIWGILFLLPSSVLAQAVITDCSGYGTSTIPENLKLVLAVPHQNTYEIWTSTRSCCPEDTGLRLPRSSHNLILGPDHHTVAYIDSANSVGVSRIKTVDLRDARDSVVSEEHGDVIDLQWVDETNLGFISDFQNREYKIVSIDGKSQILDLGNLFHSEESDSTFFSVNRQLNYIMITQQSGEFDVYSLDDRVAVGHYSGDTNRLTPYGYVWPITEAGLFHLVNNDWNYFDLRRREDFQFTSQYQYRLERMSVNPQQDKAVIQGVHLPFSRPNPSTTLLLWNEGQLIDTCQYGVIAFADSGWDVTGNNFAFSLTNQNGQGIYVIDVYNNRLFEFDFDTFWQLADDNIIVLGWSNQLP